MAGKPTSGVELSADELAARIREMAQLPANDHAGVDDRSADRDTDTERLHWHDFVLAHLDGLDLSELRALGRQLASVERGRRVLRRVDDVDVGEIDDVIACLRLQQGAQR